MGKDCYLFWIYANDFFLGGGITRNPKDGEMELKMRQGSHPTAEIIWEDDKYTYEEARRIAFVVAKTVQRLQPGFRQSVLPSLESAKRQLNVMLGNPSPSPEDTIRLAEVAKLLNGGVFNEKPSKRITQERSKGTEEKG